MTPNQASEKLIEKLVFSILQDQRLRQQPKFNLAQIVHTAEIKRVYSKGDSTKMSYKLYTITEVIHDTIPSYRKDYLPERYNENLLKSTNLTFDENNKVMIELSLIQKNNK